MKKSHKNTIFSHMLGCSLGFDNFLFNSIESQLKIIYKPYDGLFKFDVIQHGSDFEFFTCASTLYKPGFPHVRNDSSWFHINRVLGYLDDWMYKNIAPFIEEEETIDLLEEYTKGVNLSAISPIDYNSSDEFSIEQREQIRLGFNELKLMISNTYASTAEQVTLVNSRINYLMEATNRLNKTDWKGIFISTVIGIITTLTLDTQRGNDLLTAFITILHVIPDLFKSLPSAR
jgi:hypothetical protein